MGECEIRPQASGGGAPSQTEERAEVDRSNAAQEVADAVRALALALWQSLRRPHWPWADKDRAFCFATKFAEVRYGVRPLPEMDEYFQRSYVSVFNYHAEVLRRGDESWLLEAPRRGAEFQLCVLRQSVGHASIAHESR